MSSLLKNLLVALCVTIVLGVVYYFTIGSSTDKEFTEQVGNSSDIALRTQKILADIEKTKGYKMNVSLLDETRFSALTDFGVTLPNVDTGRANPFAPVE